MAQEKSHDRADDRRCDRRERVGAISGEPSCDQDRSRRDSV